jgi:hypothetical protein
MGQANQRGAAQQRAQQARENRRAGLQPVDIDALRATHNVPADAEFIGFIVWLRERDEFLVQVEDGPVSTKRAYGRVVDAAVRFATWDDAAPHAEASKHPAIVAAAFDMGNQICIIGARRYSPRHPFTPAHEGNYGSRQHRLGSIDEASF